MAARVGSCASPDPRSSSWSVASSAMAGRRRGSRRKSAATCGWSVRGPSLGWCMDPHVSCRATWVHRSRSRGSMVGGDGWSSPPWVDHQSHRSVAPPQTRRRTCPSRAGGPAAVPTRRLARPARSPCPAASAAIPPTTTPWPDGAWRVLFSFAAVHKKNTCPELPYYVTLPRPRSPAASPPSRGLACAAAAATP